jgi:hypothetical protein
MGEELRSIYFVGSAMCAVMVFVNLALVRRRGSSAVALAAAFLTMSALCWAVGDDRNSAVLPLSILVVALLLADFALRARATGSRQSAKSEGAKR